MKRLKGQVVEISCVRGYENEDRFVLCHRSSVGTNCLLEGRSDSRLMLQVPKLW
jgi:hypothetical protein